MEFLLGDSSGTQVQSLASFSGLRLLLQHRLQLQLRSDPWPRNSICCVVAKKKKKKKKKDYVDFFYIDNELSLLKSFPMNCVISGSNVCLVDSFQHRDQEAHN